MSYLLVLHLALSFFNAFSFVCFAQPIFAPIRQCPGGLDAHKHSLGLHAGELGDLYSIGLISNDLWNQGNLSAPYSINALQGLAFGLTP